MSSHYDRGCLRLHTESRPKGSMLQDKHTHVRSAGSQIHGRKRRKTNREQKAETTAFLCSDREREINGEKELHTETHQTAGMSWLSQTTTAISREREGGRAYLAAAAPSKSNTRATAKKNHCKETMNLSLTLSVSALLSRIPPLEFVPCAVI